MHSELEFDAASHDIDAVIMHLENIETLLWRILCRIEGLSNVTLKTEVEK